MQHALEVKELTTCFNTSEGNVTAVNNVSFSVQPGEIMGLVGESGSGKSVTGFSILNLIESPGEITHGQVLVNGIDLLAMSAAEVRKMRGKHISMVFQDPMMTLNPVLKIGKQMTMAIQVHKKMSKKQALARAQEVLEIVGIPAAKERLDAYPHELSGGMRQRVAIAIALLHEPAVIIADEPTTALDVSIQGQILSEVRRLADETNTAIVWVSHDLSVVSSLADKVSVMYAGQIVESGDTRDIINNPQHPYTQGLLASVPSLHEPGSKIPQIPGSAPSLANLPEGCAFKPRCHLASDQCNTQPAAQTSAQGYIRCHHVIN
ncbi:ABC transporter ATP-binding protein [Vibrio sp. TH_r3]|uniref:ABC transporter ATP-binding protein n=1 Tax=Vibrio sp. TH_r3 TaxID=3082084 RepID=UPI0029553ED6|nr:ABC transporter ATP-binding protein [Vibrio sp. TH_r3]MDV7103602.1 ABC transporter ATP-binding protein [Vibrio sp. TH_r3]